MFGPVRTEVRSPASAREVLGFLLSGAGLPFRVARTGPITSTVVLRSGISGWSFGESIEVSVLAQGTGSVLLVRASRVVPWNITADPRKVVDRILDAVSARFGPLTVVG
jgi:hypothetical protein